ncbi:MAG TPA: type II toxin-antitoxin system VapC family toxin [Vicinamibacteria bacterium]|nr:type II toxin-antitoxin system VapC family toxin [Vicinamibacteria bacterium]
MNIYLDTSTVLRVLFGEPGQLETWGRWSSAFSSELLRVEARRAIDRLRLLTALNDEDVAAAHDQLRRIEESLAFIRLTPAVLHRASLPMATAVRTLDALHLASSLLYQERRRDRLLFGTHDRSQATAARALGFQVVGV